MSSPLAKALIGKEVGDVAEFRAPSGTKSFEILEVKYNELIPDFIRFRLELNHLEQASYSKFNNCIDNLNRRF